MSGGRAIRFRLTIFPIFKVGEDPKVGVGRGDAGLENTAGAATETKVNLLIFLILHRHDGQVQATAFGCSLCNAVSTDGKWGLEWLYGKRELGQIGAAVHFRRLEFLLSLRCGEEVRA